MKKLLKFNFIIIFLLTCFFPLNTLATEPDDELDLDKISFPASYGTGDFAISIDGVDLNIYAMPVNVIAKTRGIKKENLTPEQLQERYSLIKPVIEDKPTKVIHLTNDDIVLDKVTYEESSNKKFGLFQLELYGLESLAKYDNRVLNKEFEEYMDYLNYIEGLDGAEPDPNVEEKQMPEYYYFMDIVAKISFDKVPDMYKYIYNKNYMKISFNTTYNPNSLYDVPRINLHQTYNYSLTGLCIVGNEGYCTDYITNGNEINVVELSQNSLQTSNDRSDKTIIIDTMYYDLDKIQDMNLDESILIDGNILKKRKLNYRYVNPSQPKDLEVAVENTAATYPLYIYVLSAIGILVGALVIVSTRLQSKQKQVQ